MRAWVTTSLEVAGMGAVAAGTGVRFGVWAGLICAGVAAIVAGVAGG